MGKITDLDEIRTLAITLMFEHKLNGWKFVFTTAVRQYGHCSHRQKVIGISKHISPMNSLEETRNTILHEIAHALVGPGHGHDQVWKNMAVEI